jgi:hypothetical protein
MESLGGLLDSGSEPSTLEREGVANYVAKYQNQLSLLRIKMESLAQAMDWLQVEEARSEGIVQKCKSVLSPLHCFPTEVLTHIFLLASPDYISVVDRNCVPWTLTGVSGGGEQFQPLA